MPLLLIFDHIEKALQYIVVMSIFRCGLMGMVCLMLMACGSPREGELNVAWYWWKTVYDPDSIEKHYFKSTGAKALALRLFDVDTAFDGSTPIPKAIVKQVQAPPDSCIWVPVVYLTRAALLTPGNLDTLAFRIGQLVSQLCAERTWTEIQWDHDWTPKTRTNYFLLLEKLKQQSVFAGKTFVASIRLHQLQQIQSQQVPPVNKGLLMVYNMGNLTRYETPNSILDETILNEYLPHLDHYPLPLDWALPVFAWSIQFRQNRFVAIFNGVREEAIKASLLFDELPQHRFRCRKAGYVSGFAVQAGDVLRTENTDVPTLTKIVRNLRAHQAHRSRKLYFFDWQKKHIPYFSSYDIQRISQAH